MMGVILHSAIAFSMCVKDATSRVVNVVLATLDVDVRAPVDLDEASGSIVPTCSITNPETKKVK